MRFRRLHALTAAGAFAVLSMPAVARADPVTEWNLIASNAIVATAGEPPHRSTVSFAMVQGAVYDAVNAIDGSHRSYLGMPLADSLASKDAAAATAAHNVLVALFPAQQTALDAFYEASLAHVDDGLLKDEGIAVGARAADAMLVARLDDKRYGDPTFQIVYGTDPGEWRLAPPQGPQGLVARDPFAYLGNVRPFLVPDIEMLRTDPPNALTSDEYTKEFNEVKELGSLTSTRRTPYETEAAIFWQDHGAAIWNRVLRSLSASHELSTADNARLFAMTDLAAADAAIGCWNNKYHWYFWRPITAIREAATDGNPATEADATWTPLFDPTTPVTGAPLVTPGFPDHPAGHGCVSGAFVHTLQNFFGTDKVEFTVTSNKCSPSPCAPRTFERFSDAFKEVVGARVWGGIHFRTATVQGGVLGMKVAHYERMHYFQPLG